MLLLDLEKCAKVMLIQYFIQKSTSINSLNIFYLCTCLITLTVCDFVAMMPKVSNLKMTHTFYALSCSYGENPTPATARFAIRNPENSSSGHMVKANAVQPYHLLMMNSTLLKLKPVGSICDECWPW